MDGGQPDHSRELQDLFDKIERESLNAYDITNTAATQPPAKFIPIGKIETYFRENSYERTKRLLRAVFGSNAPVSAKDVADNCCRVCCILASINQIRFIGTFFRYPNLRDNRLPFDYGHPPTHFPVDTSKKDFYERFYEEQWKYCAPELCETTSGMQFEEQSILPFISLGIIGGGGSSIVYKATVQPQHDKLRSSFAGANSNHCYAVKTYRRRDARKSYENEADAFRRITEAGTKSAPGIIGFYGSFEYRGSFNAILEYAEEGTLEQFWSKHNSPSTGLEWIAYWESLFQIVQGLWWLHDRRLPLDDGEEGISAAEKGWHQDLKPENILVAIGDRQANYKGCTFHIADFELSHFKTIMESNVEATVPGAWGTRTYGAPECSALTEATRMGHNKVKRNIDIWSLGCIFSEAAVWAVKDKKGLQDYRDNRCNAVKLIHGLSPNDVFHDKEKMLPVVQEQHDELGEKYGGTDFITGNVVFSMIGRMLKKDPAKRPTAEELVEEGERVIEQARKKLKNYEGPLQTSLSVRTPRNPLGVHDASSDTSSANRSILNDKGRFVKSPNVTMDQLDGSAAQAPAPLVETDLPHFQRSKGKSRSSGSGSAMFPAVRRSRGGSLQGSYSEDLVSSPTSTPSSRHGEVQSLPPQSPPPKRKPPVPYCSRAEAMYWYNQKKNGNVIVQLTEHGLMSELKGRDHVFMIDDSRTMDKHWREVHSLSHLLMYIVKEMDPDGVDLYFLSSKDRIHLKNSTQMEKQVDRRKPGGMTSLNRLDEDLVAYRQKIDQYAKGYNIEPPRPRNIYVLTDGALEFREDTQGQSAIKMAVESLNKAKLPRGQLGIQFISFGDNKDWIGKLQGLDRLNQDLDLGLDIVDTEPSDGNVLKMLFGAINERFDDDVISPVSSRQSAAISP